MDYIENIAPGRGGEESANRRRQTSRH